MAKEMTDLEKHYNKFNEEKRLTRRHGQVEFLTSMRYIHKYLEGKPTARILDVGAGTGRYSVALAEEGYDVTAVELVKYNLGILKQKRSAVNAMQGDARNLKKLQDNTFDLTLVFGPMYHLFGMEEKEQALREAKRVTKPGGVILVAYVMNEYGVLTYGFVQNHVKECLEDGRLNEEYHCTNGPEDLYDYMRLEDIDLLRRKVGLKRIQMIAADGPADYMRQVLHSMDEETFQHFLEYHWSTCERMDLMGASAHTVDILRKGEEA